MIALTMPDGTVRSCQEGVTLLELSRDFAGNYGSPIAEGVIDGLGHNLQREIHHDAAIDFIEIDSEEGMRVFVRSLLFLFIVVTNRLHPEVEIEVRNSLGSALYCAIRGKELTQEELDGIEAEMRRIIKAKEPIGYTMLTREEAMRYAEQDPHLGPDQLGLMEMRPDVKMIPAVELLGQKAFFIGPVLPGTEHLEAFELIRFQAGVVINYPDTGNYRYLPPWSRHRRINETYHETEEWAAMIGCNTVSKLNRIIREGKADNIIRVAEALQEKKIAAIADRIARNRKDLHFVLIAGPSSSGKTSFAQRLSVQLEVNGIRPIPISMDNYYRNRVDTPKKADGSYDFECVEAIDLALFNDHLKRLLAGETVKMPKYNFREGVREYRGDRIHMDDNSIFVVEGIHALNRRLTESVAPENKIKIFVSALTPMSLDDYNRIQTTDMRLLRRMVRDSQFRSQDALMTINMWPDVREGEEKYIFPFQEDADIFFNTTLIYEPAVLSKYAAPLMESVPREETDAYFMAQRLLELLRFIEPLDDASIPNNSILREFLGGSAFASAL